MASACPVPQLGTVYSPGPGAYLVYLKDGLHGIPSVGLVGALGYNPGLATPLGWDCVSIIGQGSDLASDYPTALAQLQNGLGQSVNPIGETVPSGSGGIIQAATQTANQAVASGNSIATSVENAFSAHESLILGGLALLVVLKSGLLKGLRI